jgi:transposase-like protein
MAGKRKSHTAAFKAEVALAAIKGDRTVNELAAQYEVHPTLIHAWKKQLLAGAEAVFANSTRATPTEDKSAELWRSVKYEDVYLRGYEAVPDLERGCGRTSPSTITSDRTSRSGIGPPPRCTGTGGSEEPAGSSSESPVFWSSTRGPLQPSPGRALPNWHAPSTLAHHV